MIGEAMASFAFSVGGSRLQTKAGKQIYFYFSDYSSQVALGNSLYQNIKKHRIAVVAANSVGLLSGFVQRDDLGEIWVEEKGMIWNDNLGVYQGDDSLFADDGTVIATDLPGLANARNEAVRDVLSRFAAEKALANAWAVEVNQPLQ